MWLALPCECGLLGDQLSLEPVCLLTLAVSFSAMEQEEDAGPEVWNGRVPVTRSNQGCFWTGRKGPGRDCPAGR